MTEYGSLSVIDKLRLLAEWGPLLFRLETVLSAETPHDKAKAVVECLQWVSKKTDTTLDDEALEHLEAMLVTAEGRAFVDWAAKKVSGD